MAQIRILIVEDEGLVALDLQSRLEALDYAVVGIAASGEAAIEMAGQYHPDLILMDIRLQTEMDGVEAAHIIRQQHGIPIVFLTAYADDVTLQRAGETAPYGYLVKPFEDRGLRSGIEMAVLRYHLELERNQLIQDLQAYAYTIAHDLKGPVSTMVGFVEELRLSHSELSADEILKYYEIIAQAGHKMARIIDELLLMASVRRTDVKPIPLDMSGIVTEAIRRLDREIKETQAEIVICSDLPKALGYGPWVEEIWVNYLSNALKFGGRPPRVEIGARHNSHTGTVRYWVRDNGLGIAPEDLERIFNPGIRLNPGVTGQGLGLSIVSRIAGKLSGVAGAESEAGQGSTFWFELPEAMQETKDVSSTAAPIHSRQS